MSSSPFSAPVALLLGLAALFAFAGCSTFNSRAKEKAAAFAALDAATQARLEARDIRVGDTPDMVYIALGKPTEKKERLTADGGRSGTWIYTARWDEYQGTRLVGYRSVSVYDPATKSHRVSYVPDYQPVYATREEDRLRITFSGGVVSVIEQAQPEAKPQNSALK
jgi:outer membrane protein assembly factor BamE (lipoprotein component of BamABCDE complex)